MDSIQHLGMSKKAKRSKSMSRRMCSARKVWRKAHKASNSKKMVKGACVRKSKSKSRRGKSKRRM